MSAQLIFSGLGDALLRNGRCDDVLGADDELLTQNQMT